jgi:hypothetical protein
MTNSKPLAKPCGHCGVDKLLKDFPRFKVTGQRKPRGAFGVRNICNACLSHLRKPTLEKERAKRARLDAAHLKACNVCCVIKPWSSFHVRRASLTDGISSTCKACANARGALWKQAHPNANKDWYSQNKAYKQQQYKDWRDTHKEYCREETRRWVKANPDRKRALVARRNAARLKATPLWADPNAIRAIYREADRLTRETGIKHEVDHIVPLRSPLVCGLHIGANLQVLTREANKKKSNHLHAAYRSAATAFL